MSEEEAWKYPDLMQIVKDKVKPERDVQKRDALRIRWWQYAEKRPGLVKAIAQCDRVLVTGCGASKWSTFAFLPANMVCGHVLIVFPLETYSAFCILQSRIHEIWARFLGSSMKDDLRYTPSDCFETFPFPPSPPDPLSTRGEGEEERSGSPSPLVERGLGGEVEATGKSPGGNSTSSPDPLSTCEETSPPDPLSTRGEGEEECSGSPSPLVERGLGGKVEAAGKAYYEFRADLMIRHNEGLTATYNRFHDPDETNPDILKLRELHEQCDRAVLDAYGWTDIPTDCEFRLDYEDEPSPPGPLSTGGEGEGRRGGRKKPWRYRWPEAVHDEVLARLLKLNQERAEEEKLGGKPKRRKEPAQPVTPDSKLPPTEKQLDLIPPDKEQLDLF